MFYHGTTRTFPKTSQRLECEWALRDYAEDDDPILHLCFAAYVVENNSSVARLGEAIAGAVVDISMRSRTVHLVSVNIRWALILSINHQLLFEIVFARFTWIL